ncbi:WD repeat-containing protein 89 [Sticta canariensis]|nr:WD repeat-containing protein 89 [Sticta canariensis]
MKPASLTSESSLSLPADSYIYKLIHTSQNAALAAISSDDSLRIFDPEQLQLQAGGIFHKTHEGVTCLETFDADPHCVLTAGRDAAGRCWDLRSERKTFEVKDVNIYDTAIADEEEALIQIINHGSSINHAGFLSNTEVYALSHDENLSVYHLTNPDENIATEVPSKLGDLRSVLHCEYIVDIVPSGNGQAIIGAGIRSTQELCLVPLQSGSQWSIPRDQAICLNGGHGPEIIRSMCLNHASQKVFTAGEDGLVKSWQMPANDEVENEKGDEEEAQPRDEKTALRENFKKTKFGKERIRGRFAPY